MRRNQGMAAHISTTSDLDSQTIIPHIPYLDKEEIEQGLRFQKDQNRTEMRGWFFNSDNPTRCAVAICCLAHWGSESGEQTAENRLQQSDFCNPTAIGLL